MLACIVLVLALLATPGRAQEPADAASVIGRVTDESGAGIDGVVVAVEGESTRVVTNADGFFRLSAVSAGPRVLVTEHIGYAVARVPVTVPPTGEVRRDIRLAHRALELEGLTVTADAVGRARGELATATVIAEDAIRHQTAASLAGVLELLPGVDVRPPSVGNVQQIPLRAAPTSGTGGGTGATDLASFGTLIVLDGVPLSNNANLQSSGSGSDLSFSTSAGGGVDLRRIPAATLERVEVIRGVPSARYGDLTQGAIVVETKAGTVEPEVQAQYDAHTLEAAAVGGWEIDERHALTAHVDYARTRSLPGVTDDHASRWAGQVAHRLTLAGRAEDGAPRLTLDTRVDAYLLEEDLPPNENTRPGFSSSTRDAGVRVSGRARLPAIGGSTLVLTGSITRVRQRARSTAGLVREAMPFTDRIEPGRSEGWFVSGRYDAELLVEGAPWLVYLRSEFQKEIRWMGGIHQLRGGAELRREWNSGDGYQFDMEFPPQVSFNGVQGYRRPRTFESIPALSTSSVYVDDRVTGSLAGDASYAIQAGLRLDALHDSGSWLPDPRDVVVQPRFSGELSPWSWLRLRGGWGTTAKVPALGDLYPGLQYNDIVNVNWFTDDPAERLAVLTTFVTDPTNANLGFSTATKAELGVEVELRGSVMSVVAFRDQIDGGVGTLEVPSALVRERFQLTDSINGNGVRPEIIEPAYSSEDVPILIGVPTNFIRSRSRGLELTATLAEIPAVRTRLQVQGSWIRTTRSFDEAYFGGGMRFSEFQLRPDRSRVPFWDGVEETGERHLMTYRLTHHQPAIGLVLTATVQHNLKDLKDDVAARDTLSFAGYVTRTGDLVRVPVSERSDPQYQDLRIARGGLLEPQATASDWMLSIQVSKTLPLGGELRFWGFNALDRVGSYGKPTRQPRIYPSVRFGVELRMSPRTIVHAL